MLLFAASGIAQKTLPDVTVKTLQGKTVRVKDYTQGKIAVVSFWATWCAPCKQELDAMKVKYAGWKEKYGVEVVAVTIDTPRQLSKVGPLVASKGWPYVILSDANSAMKNALNFPTIPQTFLVDRNGRIVHTQAGYVPGGENELEQRIKNLAR